jgi:uncharacterized tellurite resistance protein B-like protein
MEGKLLKDYTDMEKGAYLGAIASIATADHAAPEEEMGFIMTLADSADLSVEQIRNSDLRFSLMTDLISFAESDKLYTDEEKEKIKSIGEYLGINQQQFSLLNEFVEKTKEVQAQPEEMRKPGFLSATRNSRTQALI